MTQFGLVLISFVLSLVSSATTEIESAFLHNDPGLLKTLLPRESFLDVSFSKPVAFSDFLSDEQAALWFRNFFRSHQTLGFYPEEPSLHSLDHGSYIFKARWEIQTRELRQLAFDVLFLLHPEPRGRNSPGNERKGIWSITQIQAELR